MALESWPIFLQHLDIDETIPQKRRGVYFESWNSFYGIFEKNIEKFIFWFFLNKFLKIYHNLLGLCQTTWDARYDPTNVFP